MASNARGPGLAVELKGPVLSMTSPLHPDAARGCPVRTGHGVSHLGLLGLLLIFVQEISGGT